MKVLELIIIPTSDVGSTGGRVGGGPGGLAREAAALDEGEGARRLSEDDIPT